MPVDDDEIQERLEKLKLESEEIADGLLRVLLSRTNSDHEIDPMSALRGLELVTGYILSKLPVELRSSFIPKYTADLETIAREMSEDTMSEDLGAAMRMH